MTACIGWVAETTCEYGYFHGCKYDEHQAHPGRKHRCKCGATLAMPPKRKRTT